MLENLARKKSLTPAPTTRCRSCPAFASAPHGRALELPRRAPRAFLSAVKGIAKHPRHRIISAQKVHLKTMRLFFRARLGVNAADIRFRIGIRSSSHERCLTTTSNNARINESRCFYRGGVFSAVVNPIHAIFFHTRRQAGARSTGAARRASTRSFSPAPVPPSSCNPSSLD